MDQSLLLGTLSRFAGTLPTAYDVEAVIPDLIDAVVAALEVSGAGVTLATNGRLDFSMAIAAPYDALERIQVQFQSGPCHEAFTVGEAVAINDLRESRERWSEYSRAALGVGVHAVAGIPMGLAGQCIGALNLYRQEPHEWTAEELLAARVFADVATGYVVNASKVHQLEQLTEQLQYALDSRVVIEQAKGIIAQNNNIGVDDAFQLIRGHARRVNATVRAVAEAIVNVGLRL
ncbi:GAF and ANTAR domain-containing protein [Microlunatus panaciterrae]|uniref:GAF domain-containing protein n=1 Tax=Microlunatus panaciterrae TaxID=400768 RepID=A0ABS2RFE6_9ACTN|nr:GAF and ANTAR domain-containing protein [Microlunatus panaciterrae]MBM7797725.1 GAF domain-containing protein [Microlunatus panaciterrae]